MINRTTQSLLGALGVLALTLGIAEVHPPKGEAAVSGSSVATAVAQTTVVCPPPLQGQSGSTGYSLAAPGAVSSAGSSSGSGSGSSTAGAALTPLTGTGSGSGSAAAPAPSASSSSGAKSSGSTSKSSAPASAPASAGASTAPGASATVPPVAQQTQTGGGTTAKAGSGQNAPAMVGTAGGALAPGFTVQQTTTESGPSISGTSCTSPGTDFWFVGADTNKGSTGYVELSNPQANEADADIQVFGPNGEVTSTAASNIAIPGNGTTSLLLSTLIQPGNGNQVLAVHVMVRSGQVGAALHMDTSAGSDWVPATTQGDTASLPGLPGDLHQYSLTVYVPGDQDADLKVQLASQSGWITPAGHETVHIKAGMLSTFTMGDLTRGQAGLLRLTPTDPKGDAVPFVAAIQTGNSTDDTYLAADPPISQRGTVAGNSSGDNLMLTAPNGAASVTVALVGGSGSPVTKTVQIPAGSTVAVPLQSPGGTTFAVTVTPTSGGPVYAAREINRKDGLTIQQIPDDHSTVLVPTVVRNAAILVQ